MLLKRIYLSNTIMMIYKSKIDNWLIATVAIIIAGIIASVVIPLVTSFSWTALIIGIVYSSLTIALFVGLMRDTKYIVSGSSLTIRCTFLVNYRININDIREISDTKSLISSPALSLDRIKIRTPRGTMIISPAEKAEFITALRQINPNIKVKSQEYSEN